MLFSKVGDMAIKDDWGENALYHTLKNGHKDVVELLLDRGAIVSVVNMTEEQLFRISDRVIDEMIESWEDDETLKILLIKDSSNKSGLLRRLLSLFSS